MHASGPLQTQTGLETSCVSQLRVGRLHFQDIIYYVRILLQQVVEEEGYSSLELLGLGFDAMGQRSRRI